MALIKILYPKTKLEICAIIGMELDRQAQETRYDSPWVGELGDSTSVCIDGYVNIEDIADKIVEYIKERVV